ncbi:tetratricopeptide repeat protein [Actinokineospora enzanensis]|uniref:tetratricopeptide repeat protein n=1 Tax=Actinokineospora enzanensis TaxID=155975 RepID=UPI000524499D|nr:tetratricopeptide repeat protein [Actinokineospora enzanensis]
MARWWQALFVAVAVMAVVVGLWELLLFGWPSLAEENRPPAVVIWMVALLPAAALFVRQVRVRPAPAARPPDIDSRGAARVETLGPDSPVDEVFVGRDEQLAWEPAGVTMVTGPSGIGKTTFVRHHARRVAADFPGGVFLVDMRGHAPDPVAAETVRGWIRRERTLLILDNVSTPAQVLPLLPDSGDHVVLVTSREPLDLPAQHVPLGPLDADAARLLLGDHDLTDAPALQALGLPLSLRIAGALLEELSPDVLAGRLATDSIVDFAWRHLSRTAPQRAEMLRLMCLAPGPDLSTEAVAVLTGRGENDLHALRAARLVRTTAPGRWGLHDLVRSHIPPGQDENESALARLFDHYTLTAEQARQRLHGPVERFHHLKDAVDWLAAERVNLVAVVVWTSLTGHHDHAVRLAAALADHLDRNHHLTDWVVVARHARRSALHFGPRDQAKAADNLGAALRASHRFAEALLACRDAVARYHRFGDRAGEAAAADNLGTTLRALGRFDEARDAHQHAVDLHRAAADRHAEATSWMNLGIALRHTGRAEESVAATRRAIALFDDTGDDHNRGLAWNNLALALWNAGHHDEAIGTCHLAIDAARSEPDYAGEATAWSNLGLVLRDLHRVAEARDAWQRARALYRSTADHADVDRVDALLDETPPA